MTMLFGGGGSSLGLGLRGTGPVVKVVAVFAVLGTVSLLMVAPFGAGGELASAGCRPTWRGHAVERSADSVRAEQVASAKAIDAVAVSRGLPGRATLVALMTALQESDLRNLGYGDLDSVGLFQQRPSAGWGSVAQLLDPSYAADAFFGGAKPPAPRGLVDIDGWPSMSFTEAAQAVQVSAFPDAYAQHEESARAIAEEAGIDLERTGDPYAGRTGRKPSWNVGQKVTSEESCEQTSGLVSGKPVNGVWPQQRATVDDPTGTGGKVTPRTALWVAAVRKALGTQSLTCWDAHVWNPRSDHPLGRACDVMVGADARRSAVARAAGDRVAGWAITTAGQTGVRYIIWYGRIWNARSGQWKAYNGGGVYDTNDATGGHFDHVHVSMY